LCRIGVILSDIPNLCHELSHAFDIGKGVKDLSKPDGPFFANVTESKAVKAENTYRRTKGLCGRIIYDQGEVVKGATQCPTGQGCELACIDNAVGNSGTCRPLAPCEALDVRSDDPPQLRFIKGCPSGQTCNQKSNICEQSPCAGKAPGSICWSGTPGISGVCLGDGSCLSGGSAVLAVVPSTMPAAFGTHAEDRTIASRS